MTGKRSRKMMQVWSGCDLETTGRGHAVARFIMPNTLLMIVDSPDSRPTGSPQVIVLPCVTVRLDAVWENFR